MQKRKGINSNKKGCKQSSTNYYGGEHTPAQAC